MRAVSKFKGEARVGCLLLGGFLLTISDGQAEETYRCQFDAWEWGIACKQACADMATTSRQMDLCFDGCDSQTRNYYAACPEELPPGWPELPQHEGCFPDCERVSAVCRAAYGLSCGPTCKYYCDILMFSTCINACYALQPVVRPDPERATEWEALLPSASGWRSVLPSMRRP
jgi:hypothetical protein